MGATFLEGFHNPCRAVIEPHLWSEGFDFGQVSVRAVFGSAMQTRKVRAFLKLF